MGSKIFVFKKFKVKKCFKVEKNLWSKSFLLLKLLLHYSFCQKVHFRTFHDFFFDPTPHPHGGSGLSGHFSHILPYGHFDHFRHLSHFCHFGHFVNFGHFSNFRHFGHFCHINHFGRFGHKGHSDQKGHFEHFEHLGHFGHLRHWSLWTL